MLKILSQLQDADQDFEWYPTTEEIISRLCVDLTVQLESEHRSRSGAVQILDVGAGDGRVLKAIAKTLAGKESDRHWERHATELFAIEKSQIHIANMPLNVAIIGTDFHAQSLIDKPVHVVFSNPPYSEFAVWMHKILTEAVTDYVYLVVPQRWQNDEEVKRIIKGNWTYKVLGDYDFLDADRRANANVHLIRFKSTRWKRQDCVFDNAIESLLPELQKFEELEKGEPEQERTQVKVSSFGEDVVQALVDSYDAALSTMIENYRACLGLDVYLLQELGVTKDAILRGIKHKATSLKELYWKELFNVLGPIKQKLTVESRKKMLDSLQKRVNIDFTLDNVRAVLTWVLRNANQHFDSQVVSLFKRLSEFANVVMYKSNERVWTEKDWQYINWRHDEGTLPTNYRLEYRMVLHRVGGISTSRWASEARCGLSVSAFEFIEDCITVANNLGIEVPHGLEQYHWTAGSKVTIKAADGKTFATVRAFMNGNLHIHFDPRFTLALNVEAGRLLGWLRTPAQAAEELQESDTAAVAELFGANLQLVANDMQRLIAK